MVKIISSRILPTATEVDCERAMTWIEKMTMINNEVAAQLFEIPETKRIVENYCNSADSLQVTLGYTFLGAMVYISDDPYNVAPMLKGSVIKFQYGTVDARACEKINWTLYNILVDPKCGPLLFDDICKTKGFLESLFGALILHIKTAREVNLDIVTALLEHSDSKFMVSLLEEWKILTLVEVMLQRKDSLYYLKSGLSLLGALFERGELLFSPVKKENNPPVRAVLLNTELTDLLDSLNKTPFKSVYQMLTDLYSNYLPLDS